MSKQFVVGKQYKLVDASKDAELAAVMEAGLLQFPEDNTFTCHAVDSDGDCESSTKGVLWRGMDAAFIDDSGWMCATHKSLDLGAFEEVVDG